MSKVFVIRSNSTGAKHAQDRPIVAVAGSTRYQVKLALEHESGADAVLVECEAHKNQLSGDRIIGHLSEGAAALLKRCKFHS